MVESDESIGSKGAIKRKFYLPHDELLDGMNRRPSNSIHRALTWRWRTPTAAAERTMPAAGVRTASEKSRQLSASSPASSRASSGARVCARVEERIMTVVRHVFIETGTTQCYYIGAPSISHLKDTWPSCNISEVVPHSNTRLDCRVVVPTSPGFR